MTPKDFFELTKLKPKHFVAISISSGLLLFLPITLKKFFGIVSFTSNYVFIIAIVFIFSTIMVFIELILLLSPIAKKKHKKFLLKKRIKDRLTILTQDEKLVLALLIANNNRPTLIISPLQGNTLELKYANVIERVHSMSSTTRHYVSVKQNAQLMSNEHNE